MCFPLMLLTKYVGEMLHAFCQRATVSGDDPLLICCFPKLVPNDWAQIPFPIIISGVAANPRV